MLYQDHRAESFIQETLKSSIHCSGVGLHSGVKLSMCLKPAPADSGICFVRTDVEVGTGKIKARFDKVVDTKLCTVLGNRHGTRIGTVEHLLAALRGCGVDNAIIEIDGPEIPIMDGSAEPFVFLIECAGLLQQGVQRRAIKILKTVSIGNGESGVSIEPGQGSSFACDIEFDCKAIGAQCHDIRMSGVNFKQAISRARTFGRLEDVEALQKAGLAKGGSLENAVVVQGDRVLNPEGLRYKDEFARHKVLDAVGDLFLAGAPIIGHFHGTRSGHALNNQLLLALFNDSSAWCWTSFADEYGLEEQEQWTEAELPLAAVG